MSGIADTNRLSTLHQSARTAAMSIASAPVSMGIMESVEPPSQYPYSRVLDEIAKAGYAGTELGPYGFLSSDAAKLREELNKRSLTLCSAFVAIPLGNRAARSDGLAQVLKTARLVSAVGCHLLILSDEITAERCAVSGRRDEANRLSWTEAEWKDVFSAVSEVVDRCREFGVRLAFHHHVGTHVETPEELDRLLTSFSPSDLGLCLDTGHCVYGGESRRSCSRDMPTEFIAPISRILMESAWKMHAGNTWIFTRPCAGEFLHPSGRAWLISQRYLPC